MAARFRRTVATPAAQIAQCSGIVILGTGYGAPIAREAALKFKESTYMHVEGFEAGEFRHVRLGAMVADPYNTLTWLVTLQMLALHVARTRGVDSDAPRGLTKAVTSE